MKREQIKKLESDHPEIIVMESEAKSLQYLFDVYNSRFAISGTSNHYRKNGCIVTVDRAKQLVNIMENGIDGLPQFDGKYLVFCNGQLAYLNKNQAEALRNELPDIIELNSFFTERGR